MHRLSLFTAFLFAFPLHAQTTWYVDASSSGDGSAAHPFASVQAALVAASDLDQVEVAAGTYFEQLDFLGKAVRVYAPDGPDQTIIDAGGTGIVARFTQGEGAATEVVGLTLRAGGGTTVNLPGMPTNWTVGGGALCISSSPTFVACVLRDNGDSHDFPNYPSAGAGAFLFDSDARFTNCSFIGNEVQVNGGAVALYGASSPAFESTSFVGNWTYYQYVNELGGAVCSLVTLPALPTFDQCTFLGNGGGSGGGLYGRAHVTNSEFSNNFANKGGGVFGVQEVHDSTFDGNYGVPTPLQDDSFGGAAFDSVLRNCSFSANRADHGGAVAACQVYDSALSGNQALVLSGNNYIPKGGAALDSDLFGCTLSNNSCSEGGPPILSQGGGMFGGSATRCILQGNVADEGGGALNADLNHCTLVENTGRYETGAMGGGNLANSISWANEPADLPGVAVSYSCTDVNANGTGNVSTPPQMWTSARLSDLHLKPTSPCIDAADPAAPLDSDGSRADIGALPFDATHVGAPTNYSLPKFSSAGCIPLISVSGDLGLSSGGNVSIRVTGVLPNKAGWIFWSTGHASTPLFGGTLALAAPFQRSAALNSGGSTGPCSGVLEVSYPALHFGLFGHAPYTSIYAQGFYRDQAAADGTSAGMSNAVEFVLLP